MVIIVIRLSLIIASIRFFECFSVSLLVIVLIFSNWFDGPNLNNFSIHD